MGYIDTSSQQFWKIWYYFIKLNLLKYLEHFEKYDFWEKTIKIFQEILVKIIKLSINLHSPKLHFLKNLLKAM